MIGDRILVDDGLIEFVALEVGNSYGALATVSVCEPRPSNVSASIWSTLVSTVSG